MYCLKLQVYQLVDFEFQQMAQDRMKVFPILEARTRQIITNLCKSAFLRCKEGLEEYMEMEDMLYTQVGYYFRTKLDDLLQKQPHEYSNKPVTCCLLAPDILHIYTAHCTAY